MEFGRGSSNLHSFDKQQPLRDYWLLLVNGLNGKEGVMSMPEDVVLKTAVRLSGGRRVRGSWGQK